MPEDTLARIAELCDRAEENAKRSTDMGILDALIADIRAELAKEHA